MFRLTQTAAAAARAIGVVLSTQTRGARYWRNPAAPVAVRRPFYCYSDNLRYLGAVWGIDPDSAYRAALDRFGRPCYALPRRLHK